MPAVTSWDTLFETRRPGPGAEQAGLSFDELWLRYVAVSGAAGALEMEAYVLGLLTPNSLEHDLIAQAINEWFLDHGQDHPVEYWWQTTRP